MKVLNIDALAKTNRTLTLGGKTYEVLDMTVENFIETTNAAEKLGDEAPFKEQLNATIEMIQRHVPGIDLAALRGLNFEQLTMIVKFVRGDLDKELEDAPEPEQGGKPTKKK